MPGSVLGTSPGLTLGPSAALEAGLGHAHWGEEPFPDLSLKAWLSHPGLAGVFPGIRPPTRHFWRGGRRTDATHSYRVWGGRPL